MSEEKKTKLTEEQINQRRLAGKKSAESRRLKKLQQEQLKTIEEVPKVEQIQEHIQEKQVIPKVDNIKEEEDNSFNEFEEYISLFVNNIIDSRITEIQDMLKNSTKPLEVTSLVNSDNKSGSLLPLLIPLFIQFVTNSGLLTALSDKILNSGMDIKKNFNYASSSSDELRAFLSS